MAGAHSLVSLTESHQKRTIAEMWHHEDYTHTNGSIGDAYNDVAIIRLKEPLVFNENVAPIPLAPAGYTPPGTVLIITDKISKVKSLPNISMVLLFLLT